MMQGKLDEAAAELREALRLSPDFIDARLNLGAILEGQGRPDEAIAEFTSVLRIDPDDADARASLARALESRRKRGGR